MAPLHRRKSVTSLSRRSVNSLNYKRGRIDFASLRHARWSTSAAVNWTNDN